MQWQARNNAGNSSEVGGDTEEEPIERSESTDSSSASQAKLYNKLRAVEYEITAVASTVEQARHITGNEDHAYDGNDNLEQADREDDSMASPNGLNLQHALAADRLRSLKKTKAQIEKDISDFCKNEPLKDIEHNKLISSIVKEASRPKRKAKEVQKSSKILKKRLKTVSFDEDGDFDAVLDAASTGFVETVSKIYLITQ